MSYLIWSSSQHVDQISGGKLTHVTQFCYKADVEDYIRSLSIRSAFFSPGSFMQNFHGEMKPQPSHAGDGTYVLANIVAESTEMPFIDIEGDTGKFVGAVLAEPDKYEGKVLSAATKLYSYLEIVEALSKTTGKTVVYKQLPVDMFKSFLPPHFDVELVEMFQLCGDYGYYGPDQREKVEWSAKQVRGKLATLEEYLRRHPVALE